MAGQTINISVLADTGRAGKSLDTLAGRLDKIGGRFSKIGTGLGVVTLGVGAALGGMVKQASDLQQNVGGVEAVFGRYAKSVIRDSNAAAEAFGLSANEYDSFATLIGSQLKNAGVPMTKLAGQTKNLIGLGSDLAATFGGSTSDAVEALSSALKGEMDPIEKYGISLNQAMLQQQAVAMGLDKNTSKWTNAQKAQIILAAVTKQSGDAQGQFAKQTGTLAEQQQILRAKLANTAGKIGSALLPMVSKVADGLLKLVSGPGVKGVTDFLSKNPTLIIGFVAALAGLAVAFKTAGAVLQGWQTITKVATIVQAAFNAVMSANPIGLLITAIGLLVAGLVWFFTQTKVGQAIVKAAFDVIGSVIRAVVDWFTKTAMPAIGSAWKAITGFFTQAGKVVRQIMTGIWTVIKTVWAYSPIGLITSNWGKIMAFFRAIPAAVGAVFRTAITWLVTAGRTILTGLKNGATAGWNAVVAWFRSLPQRVAGFFTGAGKWLLGIGRNIILGLKNGILSAAGNIGKWVLSIIPAPIRDIVANALGIHSPSTVFYGFGRNVVLGLKNGVERNASKAVTAAKKLATAFTGTASRTTAIGTRTAGQAVADGLRRENTALAKLTAARKLVASKLHAANAKLTTVTSAAVATVAPQPILAVSTASPAVGNRTFNITVQAVAPNHEVGRAVVAAIRDYERIGGQR